MGVCVCVIYNCLNFNYSNSKCECVLCAYESIGGRLSQKQYSISITHSRDREIKALRDVQLNVSKFKIDNDVKHARRFSSSSGFFLLLLLLLLKSII